MGMDEGSGPTKLRIFSVKYQISYQLWANKFDTRGNMLSVTVASWQ